MPDNRLPLPRVGHIAFLNCLPLYWGLLQGGAIDAMTLVDDTPDRLSEALVAGELDVAPISLVPFLDHADELLVLPDIAVGSDGPVLSVVLVSRRPLDELDGATVALGSTSRTGVLLAQTLLEQRYGVLPSYTTMAPRLDAMLDVADAAVLIGDVALRATVDAPAAGLVVHDLGAEWREWTGLPMVFAVWAARRDFVERRPDDALAVARAFADSRRQAAEAPDLVAAQAADVSGIDVATLRRYYDLLDFSLGVRQLDGIAEFARRTGRSAELSITFL